MATEHQRRIESEVARALDPLPQIRIAYVFGSQVNGKARADSDLDIAIKTSHELDSSARAELILDTLDALATKLGSLGERADVLDLERASPTIAFPIIRDGHLVICRDPRDRIELEAKIARVYDDTRHYRELFQQAARAAGDRMKRGQLGQP